jgi:hypothetical protein
MNLGDGEARQRIPIERLGKPPLRFLAGQEVQKYPKKQECNGKDSAHDGPVAKTSSGLDAHALNGAMADA